MSTSASLSQSQERVESLSRLLDQSRLDNSSSDAEAVTNSGSSNTVHVCQSLSQESSCVDQTPATKEGDAGEAERQLRERLVALEKEVCVNVPDSPRIIHKPLIHYQFCTDVIYIMLKCLLLRACHHYPEHGLLLPDLLYT